MRKKFVGIIGKKYYNKWNNRWLSKGSWMWTFHWKCRLTKFLKLYLTSHQSSLFLVAQKASAEFLHFCKLAGLHSLPLVVRTGHSVPLVKWIFSASGFCNNRFLRERDISPQPHPQPGGPGDHTSAGLYPSPCPAWVALPGVKDSSRHTCMGDCDT